MLNQRMKNQLRVSTKVIIAKNDDLNLLKGIVPEEEVNCFGGYSPKDYVYIHYEPGMLTADQQDMRNTLIHLAAKYQVRFLGPTTSDTKIANMIEARQIKKLLKSLGYQQMGRGLWIPKTTNKD